MDRLISALLVLLETEFSTTFKDYNYGDCRVYDRTELPALFVIPNESRFVEEGSGTVRDAVIHTLTIRVLIDVKKYLNPTTTGDIQTHEQQLVKWVENTDSNGEFTGSTIVKVIRANPTISGHVLYSDSISVDYGDETIETENSLLKKADVQVSFGKRPNRPT